MFHVHPRWVITSLLKPEVTIVIHNNAGYKYLHSHENKRLSQLKQLERAPHVLQQLEDSQGRNNIQNYRLKKGKMS